MEEERLLYKKRNGRGEIVWAMEGLARPCVLLFGQTRWDIYEDS